MPVSQHVYQPSSLQKKKYAKTLCSFYLAFLCVPLLQVDLVDESETISTQQLSRQSISDIRGRA